MPSNDDLTAELCARAARLVVEEGLDYAAAKRRALRDIGPQAGRGATLPPNEQLEDAVREHIALFHADSQPVELAALRQLALRWMDSLTEFRPHLGGAVWRGTATRLSPVLIDLYCDDAKAAEIEFLNRGITFDSHSEPGDEETVLSVEARCPELGETVSVHFIVHDHDELRGALKPDARGQTWRGDAAALRQRLQEGAQGDAR
ncbi:MAG TPA: hypothetical protein VFY73_21770 [Ideonella sp.]|uniref:hypothetical protein n=1 Tax=Ideonella sp. TaxID=1929293 RepID=UPI002E34B0AC|nr:hypothetical protein [Ideonella sp.]HEX5686644.1 hypothetical protein [Ideonella sp.]